MVDRIRNSIVSTAVKIKVVPRPFTRDFVECEEPYGKTLSDILEILPDDFDAVVLHCGVPVPKEYWPIYKPKPGYDLQINVVPQAPAVALAAALFAPQIGTFVSGALGLAAGGIGATIVEGLVTIGIAGLAAKLVQPPSIKGSKARRSDPNNFGITSIRNQLPDTEQTVPMLYGKDRIYPFFAAEPYVRVSNNKQFLVSLFDLGHGPVEIADNDLLKIGERPFSEFTGISWEFHEGTPGNVSEVSSIYTSQNFTTEVSATLRKDDDWRTVTTRPETGSAAINIAFRSLVSFDGQNNAGDATVDFEVQTREEGETDFTAHSTPSVTGNSTTSFYYAVDINFSTRGQHQVRIRRTTDDTDDNTRIRDDAVFGTLVSSNPDRPVNAAGRALFALEIQATDQLNGIVDSFNGVFRRRLQRYSAGSWGSSYINTSSPAWVFADVLRGRGIFNPVPDIQIDHLALLAFDGYCAANGFTFNGTLDARQSVWDILTLVAGCGKAFPTLKDGNLFSVVIDQTKTVPVDILTPRDTLSFKGSRRYDDLPHGIRAVYRDSSDDLFEEKEVVVYGVTDDGQRRTAATATDIRTVAAFGSTDIDNVHKRLIYFLAQAVLRPERFEIVMDEKNLALVRGDYVDLVHDVALLGLGQGRLLNAYSTGGDWTGFDLDEDVELVNGTSFHANFKGFDGSQTSALVRHGDRPASSIETTVTDTPQP